MNRQMNLPALQRIAMEFEKENDIMDQRQEMMDDAIDDVTGLEDEEDSEEVVQQVLDEIGIDLGQAVSGRPRMQRRTTNSATARRDAHWHAEGSSPGGQDSAGRGRGPWGRRSSGTTGQSAAMRGTLR